MIVKNPDGSFGALNDTIYSNDLPRDIRIYYSTTQLVQGFWHSYPEADDSTDLRLIGRYPSIDDRNMLERIAAGSGAVSKEESDQSPADSRRGCGDNTVRKR